MIKNTDDSEHTMQTTKPTWWVRVGWLITIWFFSVLTLGAVAYLIKKFMTAAGMSI